MTLNSDIEAAQQAGNRYAAVRGEHVIDRPLRLWREDFHLDLRGTVLWCRGTDGLELAGRNVQVLGGHIKGYGDKIGVRINGGSSDYSIRDTRIASFSCGVMISDSYRGNLDGCRIEGHSSTGIALHAAANATTIRACKVSQCGGDGIQIKGWNDSIRVVDCTLEGNRKNGIRVLHQGNSQRRMMRIVGNHFEKNAERHLCVDYADGLCIEGNYFNGQSIYVRGSGWIGNNWIHACEYDVRGPRWQENPGQSTTVRFQ